MAAGRPCAIPELALPDKLKILVLAPHPDDFDAVGVTLNFLSRSGHAISVGVARTGSGIDDEDRPGLTLAEKADLREGEQRRSLRFFGLPDGALSFLRLENDSEDQLVLSDGNAATIEAFIAAMAPDIVFLPHGNDSNSAHRAMAAMVKQAARTCGRPLVAWFNRDPKTVAMRTDLYMPFGPDEAAWKGTLLRCHASQHQRNLRTRGRGFDERVLDVNRAIARELALAQGYAESFEMEVCNMPSHMVDDAVTQGENR